MQVFFTIIATIVGILPGTEDSIAESGLIKACIMPKNTSSGGDDSPGIVWAIKACGENARVVFEGGVTYNLFTPWKLSNLSNIEFVFDGNLTLSDKVADVQRAVSSRTYPGHWIQIGGDSVTFTGSTSQSGGWFIGRFVVYQRGQDLEGSNSPNPRPWRALVGEQQSGEETPFLWAPGKASSAAILAFSTFSHLTKYPRIQQYGRLEHESTEPGRVGFFDQWERCSND